MIPRLSIFLAFGTYLAAYRQQPPAPVISGEIPQHILFYQFFRMITAAPEASEDLMRLGKFKLSTHPAGCTTAGSSGGASSRRRGGVCLEGCGGG